MTTVRALRSFPYYVDGVTRCYAEKGDELGLPDKMANSLERAKYVAFVTAQPAAEESEAETTAQPAADTTAEQQQPARSDVAAESDPVAATVDPLADLSADWRDQHHNKLAAIARKILGDDEARSKSESIVVIEAELAKRAI